MLIKLQCHALQLDHTSRFPYLEREKGKGYLLHLEAGRMLIEQDFFNDTLTLPLLIIMF